MTPKTCVTGRHPEDPPGVPTFDSAYYRGELIEEIAEALIGAHQELSWLREGEDGPKYRIVYFWKGKGGTAKGKPVIGSAGMASGLVGHLTQATFQVVMGADHCRGLSNLELEAAIYHQLCHLHEDDSTDSEGEVTYSPAIRSHDLEMFRSELDRYGFWTQDISAASHHFATQLKLEFATDKRFEGQPNPYESVPDDNWGESDEERRRERLVEQETEEADAAERELQGISR